MQPSPVTKHASTWIQALGPSPNSATHEKRVNWIPLTLHALAKQFRDPVVETTWECSCVLYKTYSVFMQPPHPPMYLKIFQGDYCYLRKHPHVTLYVYLVLGHSAQCVINSGFTFWTFISDYFTHEVGWIWGNRAYRYTGITRLPMLFILLSGTSVYTSGTARLKEN